MTPFLYKTVYASQNIQNPNVQTIIIRISVVWTISVPNEGVLSEIRMCSDFGRWL